MEQSQVIHIVNISCLALTITAQNFTTRPFHRAPALFTFYFSQECIFFETYFILDILTKLELELRLSVL